MNPKWFNLTRFGGGALPQGQKFELSQTVGDRSVFSFSFAASYCPCSSTVFLKIIISIVMLLLVF